LVFKIFHLSFWSFTTILGNLIGFLHRYPLVFWIVFSIFHFFFLDFLWGQKWVLTNGQVTMLVSLLRKSVYRTYWVIHPSWNPKDFGFFFFFEKRSYYHGWFVPVKIQKLVYFHGWSTSFQISKRISTSLYTFLKLVYFHGRLVHFEIKKLVYLHGWPTIFQIPKRISARLHTSLKLVYFHRQLAHFKILKLVYFHGWPTLF